MCGVPNKSPLHSASAAPVTCHQPCMPLPAPVDGLSPFPTPPLAPAPSLQDTAVTIWVESVDHVALPEPPLPPTATTATSGAAAGAAGRPSAAPDKLGGKEPGAGSGPGSAGSSAATARSSGGAGKPGQGKGGKPVIQGVFLRCHALLAPGQGFCQGHGGLRTDQRLG